jgi:uncharacterized membrane protein YdjX (TVP38/TMEM64 family)
VAELIGMIVVVFILVAFGTAEKGPNPLHWLLVLAILGWLIFYIGILAPRRLHGMGRIRLGR